MSASNTTKRSQPSQRRYPPEIRERAVRMVREALKESDRSHGVVTRVAGQLGLGSETLRKWVKQAEIDHGERPGVTSEEQRRITDLERENGDSAAWICAADDGLAHAAGINATDWKQRKGLMGGELPQTTGRDVAGVVDEVGEGVTDVTVGDRVFGLSDDGAGAAELALLSDYAPIPLSLGFAEAAGLPVAIETATRTLDALGVGARSTLLVNGAAGGVGSAAIQLAVARGARVIGTASPANHDYLRSLGAQPSPTARASSSAFARLRPTVSTWRSTSWGAASCPS